MFAYFSNQPLWYELFHIGLSDGSPSWLGDMMSDYFTFDNVMGTLVDYCFLEVPTEERKWSMHACVHDWIVAGLNRKPDLQQYWYAFDCVAGSINPNDQDSLAHLSYSHLAAHATWLVQSPFYQHRFILDMTPDRLEKAYRIALLLWKQTRLSAAEVMLRQVLAVKQKAPDHTSTLGTANDLGILDYSQGRLQKAEERYQQALAGKQKALGPNHTSTFDTINNLGILYQGQGRLQEAETMHQQALAGYEKALGPDNWQTQRRRELLSTSWKPQRRLGWEVVSRLFMQIPLLCFLISILKKALRWVGI